MHGIAVAPAQSHSGALVTARCLSPATIHQASSATWAPASWKRYHLVPEPHRAPVVAAFIARETGGVTERLILSAPRWAGGELPEWGRGWGVEVA